MICRARFIVAQKVSNQIRSSSNIRMGQGPFELKVFVQKKTPLEGLNRAGNQKYSREWVVYNSSEVDYILNIAADFTELYVHTEGKYEETTRYLRQRLGQLGHASRDLISINARRTMMRNAERPRAQDPNEPTTFERVLEEISEDTLAAMQTAASNDPAPPNNEDVSQMLKSRPTIIEIMSSTESVQPPPSEATGQDDPPQDQTLRNAISMNNVADDQF